MRVSWLALAMAAVLVLVFYLTGAQRFLTFDSLKHHHADLRVYVDAYPTLATLVFVALYTFIVACSIPGATVLTLASGVVFDQPFATLWSVVGAATGACCLFYITRTTFGEFFASRIPSQRLQTLKHYLQTERAELVLTMFLLRLVPVFPFFLINIAPSLLGVDTLVFVLTTYIGIIPGSWVYSECGVSLAAALSDNDLQHESMSSFLRKALFRRSMVRSCGVLVLWTVFLVVSSCYVRSRKRRRAASLLAEDEGGEVPQHAGVVPAGAADEKKYQ